MWEKLSPPWQASVEQAWESYRADSVPIGAVIVDENGQILSRGRNRLFDHADGSANDLARVPLAHAEVNALMNLDYKAVDAHNCTLYTTTEPCPMCVGAFCMANIRHLRYASRDPWCGSVDLIQASHYMREKHIQVIAPEQTNLEIILVAIQVEHHLRRGGERAKPVIEKWRGVHPHGVPFGERLLQSGFLQQARVKGIPISDVVNDLEQMTHDTVK